MRALGENRMTDVRCKNTITRHRRGARDRVIHKRSEVKEDSD